MPRFCKQIMFEIFISNLQVSMDCWQYYGPNNNKRLKKTDAVPRLLSQPLEVQGEYLQHGPAWPTHLAILGLETQIGLTFRAPNTSEGFHKKPMLCYIWSKLAKRYLKV